MALLPFIDEVRLKEAMKDCEPQFTPEERERNSQGHNLIFVHTSHPLAATFKALQEDEVVSPSSTSTVVPAETGTEYLSVVTDAPKAALGMVIFTIAQDVDFLIAFSQ